MKASTIHAFLSFSFIFSLNRSIVICFGMKKDSLLFSSTNNMPNINLYQQMEQELKRLQCEYMISIYQICMKTMFRVQMRDDTSCFFRSVIGVKHVSPLSFELMQIMSPIPSVPQLFRNRFLSGVAMRICQQC